MPFFAFHLHYYIKFTTKEYNLYFFWYVLIFLLKIALYCPRSKSLKLVSNLHFIQVYVLELVYLFLGSYIVHLKKDLFWYLSSVVHLQKITLFYKLDHISCWKSLFCKLDLLHVYINESGIFIYLSSTYLPFLPLTFSCLIIWLLKMFYQSVWFSSTGAIPLLWE